MNTRSTIPGLHAVKSLMHSNEQNDRKYSLDSINLLFNSAATAITDIWSADYSFYVLSVKVDC